MEVRSAPYGVVNHTPVPERTTTLVLNRPGAEEVMRPLDRQAAAAGGSFPSAASVSRRPCSSPRGE